MLDLIFTVLRQYGPQTSSCIAARLNKKPGEIIADLRKAIDDGLLVERNGFYNNHTDLNKSHRSTFAGVGEQAQPQELRKSETPELKPANLINKFYERYPVASFKSDTDRAAALGYFMAGAEVQCFGEFVNYEDMFCDE